MLPLVVLVALRFSTFFALALCDWSVLQQKRRNLARKYCSPRTSSLLFAKMSRIACFETTEMMKILQQNIIPGKPFELKPLIQLACANMFLQYMCSFRFDYEDQEFRNIVQCFDEIFWEINQGYAVDFLPWLLPFYKKHFAIIKNWSTKIRKFILERIVHKKEQKINLDNAEQDFTDILLQTTSVERSISRNTIIFMLEDFIGGHSAVGNLVMLVLIYMAKYPKIAKKVQAEADYVSRFGERGISLNDKESMPYTMATILEVLRYSSSPIVPHVATENVEISGFGIPAGSIVFINNYNLNKSNEYWTNAEQFNPERFLDKYPYVETKTNALRNRLLKNTSFDLEDSNYLWYQNNDSWKHKSDPKFDNNKFIIKKRLPHFLPFSIGKRTCIGQKLVEGFGFVLLANILQQYDIQSDNVSAIKVKAASVALPAKTFSLVLSKRLEKI